MIMLQMLWESAFRVIVLCWHQFQHSHKLVEIQSQGDCSVLVVILLPVISILLSSVMVALPVAI